MYQLSEKQAAEQYALRTARAARMLADVAYLPLYDGSTPVPVILAVDNSSLTVAVNPISGLVELAGHANVMACLNTASVETGAKRFTFGTPP